MLIKPVPEKSRKRCTSSQRGLGCVKRSVPSQGGIGCVKRSAHSQGGLGCVKRGAHSQGGLGRVDTPTANELQLHTRPGSNGQSEKTKTSPGIWLVL